MTVCVDDCVFFLCSIISDISVLKLKVDKCSRQDNLFMKKVCFKYLHSKIDLSVFPLTHHPLCLSSWQHGQQLYRHIYLGCKEQSSGRQHYETLFALLGLLSVELANEEVVVDLIRLALALQVPMRIMCDIFTCLFCLEINMTLAVTTAKIKTLDKTRQTFFKMSRKTNNK